MLGDYRTAGSHLIEAREDLEKVLKRNVYALQFASKKYLDSTLFEQDEQHIQKAIARITAALTIIEQEIRR